MVLPQGAPAITDPARVAVQAGDVVEVSLHFPEDAVADTFQRSAAPKGMIVSEPGDFTAQGGPLKGADAAIAFVGAVEVLGPRRPGLVIFGDTKSAGPGTWPDFLVPLTGGRMAVANRSQYAGLMALGAPGDSGLARFDRDVLSATGATHVLIFNGNNDLIQPGAVGSNGRPLLDPALTQTAEQLITAQAQAALRARSAGLKTIGGTWLPYEGVAIEGYATPEKAAKRQAVNAWMRSSRLFDMIIDFEAALKDPAHPGGLLPAYDSGNHFTPSAAGYRRMAEAAWTRLKTLV
jgi:lysophospholipase L1-like esterase